MNRQLALSIQLNDDATLADFSFGSNALLQQQLLRALDGNGDRLFYLWGASGSGKSHLLQACCQAMPHAASIYLPLQILREWGPESIEDLGNQSLIALDDMDAIAGDKAWEEALFHLFNRVRDNGNTLLLMSSRQPLSSLAIQLADLKSRLAWGLVVQIHEMDDELKINTLQHRAKKRGFVLPFAVGQFLINRCARNMHDLQTILDELDKASLAAQRKITLPFVKDVLGL
ncbi:MAG: DnaA regulatory inactivator Hda [Tatlockia sp.]|jgi:DnaA family protein